MKTDVAICRSHSIEGCVYCSDFPIAYLVKIYDSGGNKAISTEVYLLEHEALTAIENLTDTEWVSLERIRIVKQTI